MTAIALVGALVLSLLTLGSPRVHDVALMEYMAWLFRNGLTPYRDVFDMNFPGTYLLHMGSQSVFGVSDLAVQAANLVIILIAAAAIWRLGSAWQTESRATAIFLLVAGHVFVGGAYDAMERDWVMGALYLAVLALVAPGRSRTGEVAEGGPPVSTLCVAGLLGGFTVTMKPQGALILVAVPLVLAVAFSRRGRQLARDTAIVWGAALVSIGAVFSWVLATGGFSAWTAIIRTYLPLYSLLDGNGIPRDSLWVAAGSSLVKLLQPSIVLLLIAVVVSWLLVGRGLQGARRSSALVLLVAIVVGLLHAWSGFKLWRYHFAPFQMAALTFIGLMAFETGERILERVRLSKRARVRLPQAAFSFVVIALVVLGILSPPGQAASVREIEVRTVEAAEFMRSLKQPGDRVQILDTYEAGMNTALRAELKPATRFVYDFHFFHNESDPAIVSLRQEFVESFDANQPRFVLLVKTSWGARSSIEALDRFPELSERLRLNYTIGWDDGFLQVLVRKEI